MVSLLHQIAAQNQVLVSPTIGSCAGSFDKYPIPICAVPKRSVGRGLRPPSLTYRRRYPQHESFRLDEGTGVPNRPLFRCD